MSLETVTFEANSLLEKIGDAVFINCRLLQKICIPSRVKEIGDRCFAGCLTLSLVTFEHASRLKSVGEGAFNTGDGATPMSLIIDEDLVALLTEISSLPQHVAMFSPFTSVKIFSAIDGHELEHFSSISEFSSSEIANNSKSLAARVDRFFKALRDVFHWFG
jgi:hypothetical protein